MMIMMMTVTIIVLFCTVNYNTIICMNTSFRVVAAYALYLDFFDTVCSYKCHTILPYAYI